MKKEIGKFFKEFKLWFFVLTEFGILVDIFLIDSVSDLVVLFLICLWILAIWVNKFKPKVSILNGLVLIIFCPLLLIMGNKLLAEKFAIWAYLLLTIGIFQEIFTQARGKWIKRN